MLSVTFLKLKTEGPIVYVDLCGMHTKTLADGDGFQCSNSSASNDDFDDEPLLNKLCVLLCMLQNAPECASEHLKLSKFPGEACSQTP